MWCISAYEYVIGVAKMTKIFAVYTQPAVFPSLTLTSEYAISLVVITFVSTLHMFDNIHNGLYFLRSFLFPFLNSISTLPFFHAVGIRVT